MLEEKKKDPRKKESKTRKTDKQTKSPEYNKKNPASHLPPGPASRLPLNGGISKPCSLTRYCSAGLAIIIIHNRDQSAYPVADFKSVKCSS